MIKRQSWIVLCLTLVTLPPVFGRPVPGKPLKRVAPVDRSGYFEHDGAAARLEEIDAAVSKSNLPNLIGVDRWEALVESFRPGITGCTTHKQFAALTNKLVKAAHWSHFKYYTDDDWSFWHVRSAFGGGADTLVEHVGIFPERIDNRWFVRGIFEESPADGVDIVVGDQLVAVDGKPFSPIAPFRGKAETKVTLTLRRHVDGPTFSVELTPVKESLHSATQRAIRNSISVIKHDGHRMAYMHAWSLLGNGKEYDLLTELQDDVDGLVLDFRDGFGGTWFRAQRFLVGNGSLTNGPHGPQWEKPVVILIDDGTRSAKEIVVDTVRRTRRAPLVGEPTPGAVTSVGGFHRVGKDGMLMLPGMPFELEGHPTQPDYLVPRPIPFCAGQDAQLVAGKDLLARMITEGIDGLPNAVQP